LHTWRSGPTTKGKPRRFALQAALRFALHHRTPLLYKPLGHRAEAPPHGQVAPTLPEESWGQVYTFVLWIPEGETDGTRRTSLAPTRLHTWRSGPTTKGKPRRFAIQAALRFALHHRIPLRISLLLIFGFPFFLSRRGTPPFYISLWDTARRFPRTVKSPQLSLRRVGAKCTLSFFGFPKG